MFGLLTSICLSLIENSRLLLQYMSEFFAIYVEHFLSAKTKDLKNM